MFRVPDAYFDQLPAAIGDKINRTYPDKPVYLSNWVKYSISLATVCLLLLLGYGLFAPCTQADSQLMTDISNQEIVEYLQQTDVSAYDLIEAASAANISIPVSLPEETMVDTELLLDEAESTTLEELI